jgi:hypothetical protein
MHLFAEKIEYDYNTIVEPLGSAYTTTINLKIHNPTNQMVKYIPGVMETLKFAWVQYVMFLIPCLYLAYLSVGFLFQYRILEAVLISDLQPKRKLI